MPKKAAKETPEIQELRAKLEEAQETLNAIRHGEVDGLVVSTPKGEQVYTITGADKPYRVLIEEMREGAVMLSVDNTVLYCNQGFARIVGLPIERIIGRTIQSMVLPTHMKDFENLLTIGRTGKGTVVKEITLQSSDKPIPTLMSVNSFKMDSVETTFLVATDLTEHMQEELKSYTNKLETEIIERKKAEEALKLSEEHYRSLFVNMEEGFSFNKMVFDEFGNSVDFIVLEANKAFEDTTGLKREKVIGKRLTEAHPKVFDDIGFQKIFSTFANVAETGKSERFELYSRSMDKWLVGLVYSPMKGYFAVLNQDDTERKKADEKNRHHSIIQNGIKRIFQEALSSTEEALGKVCLLVAEEITQSKFGFIGEINEEGLEDIAISNPGWDECKVITSKGHKATSGSFKIHGIYGKVIIESKGFFTNDPDNFPSRVGLPLGHPPLKSFLGVPLVNQDKTIGIVAVGNREGGYGKDELEALETLAPAMIEAILRKRAEVQLEDYKKNLEKIVEERTKQLKDSERLAAIGATAGMVGHDIRNPLQSITGDVFLAKSELDSIPESDEKKSILESLQEIERNTEYINKIVADLQDFARPLQPKAEETDLKLIIDQLLAKNGMPENVKVSVNLESGAKVFVADSTFMNRIMYNLVNNAVQAMPQGGDLTIHAFKEAKDVVISVKDTGVGIPDAVKGKLFTPMFTTKSKGQGFGLAVIKRMTEALGGTVRFESEEGKGTTFIVRLPLPQELNGKWALQVSLF